MGRTCVHAHELRMCVYGIYVIHMCVPAGVHCVVCADIHVYVHACLLYVGHAHICTNVCMCVYMYVCTCGGQRSTLAIITGTTTLFSESGLLTGLKLAEKTRLTGQRALGISLSLLPQ